MFVLHILDDVKKTLVGANQRRVRFIGTREYCQDGPTTASQLNDRWERRLVVDLSAVERGVESVVRLCICLFVVDLLQVRGHHVDTGVKRLLIGGDDVTRRVGVRVQRRKW